jgi:drug/metabolite transporter (DMT)-like permease
LTNTTTNQQLSAGKAFRADALLLLTALIWGTAFVAQRLGMNSIGPMLYNGLRFALGALIILPLALWSAQREPTDRRATLLTLRGGIAAGVVLFVGASLQQFGLLYTSVANAGFITGLYIIIVPLLGLFLGHRIDAGTWLGVALAVVGMYFLSIQGEFTVAFGDLLQLGGALFWAIHVLVLDALTPHTPTMRLACLQFFICSLLCLIGALFTEPIAWTTILQAAPAVAYGGVLSVGIGYIPFR